MIDTLLAMIEQQAKDSEGKKKRKETMSERKKEEKKETMLKNHLPLCVSHSTTTQSSYEYTYIIKQASV
jgi:hypothetical protein